MTSSPARGEVIPFQHTLALKPRDLSTTQNARGAIGHAILVDKDRIVLVDESNGLLVELDRASGEVVRRVPVGDRPDRVLIARDGTRYVSVRSSGEVVLVSPEGEELRRVRVGHEPRGLAMDGTQEHLLVALEADGLVVTLDRSELTPVAEPMFAPGAEVVAFEAGRVFAGGRAFEVLVGDDYGSFLLGNLRSDAPYDSLSRPDRAFLTGTPNRVRGIAIQPETGATLVVHHQALTGGPASDPAFEFMEPGDPEEGEEASAGESGQSSDVGAYGMGSGGGSTDPRLMRPVEVAVSALDSFGDARLTVRDPVSHLPMFSTLAVASDIVHSPTHTMALVSGFSSDNVVAFETSWPDPMAFPIAVFDVGQAPRGVAFSEDGLLAYTVDAHSYTVSRLDIGRILDAAPILEIPVVVDSTGTRSLVYEPPCAANASTCPPGPWIEPLHLTADSQAVFDTESLPSEVVLGRRAFTFAGTPGLTTARQLACASCHIEGSEDGLVWQVPEGPRQTPALAGRVADTGPFNWNGGSASLEHNMVRTVTRMGGSGLSLPQRKAIATFLASLKAPANPNLLASGLTDQQEAGRRIFEDPTVRCATCHPGPSFTDGRRHDVGIGFFSGEAALCNDVSCREVNTPSLRGLWATAPYFHDGSAATLGDALDATGTTMGNTAMLTWDEREALLAYLSTL